MLLTIDVGNTKTVVGLFNGTHLLDSWYFDTCAVDTADDAAVQLGLLMGQIAEAVHPAPTRSAISCVVTHVLEAWCSALTDAFGEAPLVCTTVTGAELGLFELSFEDLHEVGPDLVADAIAARCIYGSPCVVIDYGTATTWEYIDAEGRLTGVAIAPGAETSMAALFKNAEAINEVPVVAPGRVAGQTTLESVQSGIVFGEAMRSDGMVRLGMKEMGCVAPVVATGGLCEIISAHSECTTAVDKMLTLRGLQMMDAAKRAQAAAAKAAEEAAKAEAAAAAAKQEEAKLRKFRSGEYQVQKVTALKGSPLQ